MGVLNPSLLFILLVFTMQYYDIPTTMVQSFRIVTPLIYSKTKAKETQ